ncbi:5-beta-cholestane-3-alpha,7-alpha-diol 12-alpha-hydroxylase-like [Eublepharis macularius]|uniref:5-beta-cholestane-3-alpha,7-alpha-diol 12-alpha-hydroxylase-like n=1 Tax=Eublepharis macularius TaxID=481883 RepID=A0AA97K3J1_EUBMA|nr:5-beta-cholestane-3-alpha,7-alpha-diol 12-alpha-hydroxylase-like [Eublepharis macularius]
MAAWETVLFSLLLFLFSGLYLMGAFRRRRAKEPPLDKGFIPWLGYALDFKQDGLGVLQRMRKKHGDIFTLLIGGHFITFVLEPHSYGAIVKESKSKLDFDMFGSEFVSALFRFHPAGEDHKLIQASSVKYLMGDGLAVMNQAMVENLQTVMFHKMGSKDGNSSWQEDGVYHYSCNTIFKSSFLSFFGHESNDHAEKKAKLTDHEISQFEMLFEKFQKFDHLVPSLVYNTLAPGKRKEAQQLYHLFWDILSVNKIHKRYNVSNWVSEQERTLAEKGMPENIRTRFLFLLLWTVQTNTGPASFWVLVHLLKCPEAMEAARKEVNGLLKENGPQVKLGDPLMDLTRKMLTKSPVLESVIEETLRLKVQSILMRAVVKDMDLKMDNGRKYALRKGDRIALSPYVAMHIDPEVYPEPLTFQYDRFLNFDGSVKSFYKNGKKLKYHNMPFGMGPSKCPGRFLAVTEIKTFVFLMLAYFDIELVNGEEEIPPADKSQFGFGTILPVRDIQFRYRLRCQLGTK